MTVKTILNSFRTNEWWGNKIPGVLGIGYATSIKNDGLLMQLSPSILFVFVSIVVGAIYVSTINDLTDIDEDQRSGKLNRMSKIPSPFRWYIPIISALIGIFFIFCFLPDTLSAILYLLPWLSFSLYSVRPVRLKQRGFWGVIADASGAHVFVSLLMVSYVTYVSGELLDVLWFCSIGLWSLFFGMRGILWHQFADRENDIKVKSTTFATGTTPEDFRISEKILFIIELAAFTLILINLSILTLYIFVLCYCVLAFTRYRILGHRPVVILTTERSTSQILMLDLYQVFFPIGLLIHICIQQPEAWIILFVHLLFFPGRPISILKDVLALLKSAKKNMSKTDSAPQDVY
jgi:4-hydroxybenzoate polyprenyltransferase